MGRITLQRTVRAGRGGSSQGRSKRRLSRMHRPDPPDASPGAIDPLLDERQVAQVLRISVRTLQGWRITGSGPPYVKLGGAVRYRRSEIQQHILDSLRGSTSDPGPRDRG